MCRNMAWLIKHITFLIMSQHLITDIACTQHIQVLLLYSPLLLTPITQRELKSSERKSTILEH